MALNLEAKVIYKLNEEVGENSKYGTTIRVVQWVRDGEDVGEVQLEKRVLIMQADGQWRTGQAKGFKLADLRAINSKMAEIQEAMGG